MKRSEYLELLGLRESATQREVKEAYRAMAKLVHPDINPTPEAHEAFVFLTEAYGVLTKKRLPAREHVMEDTVDVDDFDNDRFYARDDVEDEDDPDDQDGEDPESEDSELEDPEAQDLEAEDPEAEDLNLEERDRGLHATDRTRREEGDLEWEMTRQLVSQHPKVAEVPARRGRSQVETVTICAVVVFCVVFLAPRARMALQSAPARNVAVATVRTDPDRQASAADPVLPVAASPVAGVPSTAVSVAVPQQAATSPAKAAPLSRASVPPAPGAFVATAPSAPVRAAPVAAPAPASAPKEPPEKNPAAASAAVPTPKPVAPAAKPAVKVAARPAAPVVAAPRPPAPSIVARGYVPRAYRRPLPPPTARRTVPDDRRWAQQRPRAYQREQVAEEEPAERAPAPARQAQVQPQAAGVQLPIPAPALGILRTILNGR